MKPPFFCRPLSCSLLFLVSIVVSGCAKPSPPSSGPPLSAHELTKRDNAAFLRQKTFDPWILKSSDGNNTGAYIGQGDTGQIVDGNGNAALTVNGGKYFSGVLTSTGSTHGPDTGADTTQELNLQTGTLTTRNTGGNVISTINGFDGNHWTKFWQNTNVQILGDPEAQQVTHANLFYLTSSLQTGNANSVPPMGLSSTTYNGRIFWDAEIWMFPALVVQHPDLARTIIDYRYKLLPQAIENAKEHGYKGAEYPWESTDDGKEWAPAEFSQERHVTADIAFASWQYYLWTGNLDYLKREEYPILKANADYWASRVTLGPDKAYHIKQVIGPDETAGIVDDDAWTNAIVQDTLRAAVRAAPIVGQTPDPKWQMIASNLLIPYDAKLGQYLQYPNMELARHQAKQADAQMLIYPLGIPMSAKTAGKTLDYSLQHTITVGPAMTSSIDSVIAARLGRARQSLDLFHDSYRPFMRAPFDAFSEKRTTNNVYFCTGMGGCLQCLYCGFGGLQVVPQGEAAQGRLIAKSGDASLFADPHLPPGWTGLTVKGVQFRGEKLDIVIQMGNRVSVSVSK